MPSDDHGARFSTRMETAFGEFMAAWQAGDRPDVDDFCKRHAECGSTLREKIEAFVLVARGLEEFRKTPALPLPLDLAKTQDGSSDVYFGDFRIIRKLGEGGMGYVYEAEQVSLRRHVALKILDPRLSYSLRAVEKFRREAEAGGRQRHPGIVAVYAIGKHDNYHFIAQELVEGGNTLADEIATSVGSDHLSPEYFRRMARLIADVADALQHAHDSGVIHRDVKPSNLLLTTGGEVKVADFGLAKVEDALSLTQTGELSGTPHYMSPEQASSKKYTVDSRTDIFSLGVTLYEVLTLELPFQGATSRDVLESIYSENPKDPRRRNQLVPDDLAVICLKALEKNPARRYQAMVDFGGDLDRYLRHDVIVAKPVGIGRRIQGFLVSHKIASILTLAGIVAATVVAVVSPWLAGQTTRSLSRENQELAQETRVLGDRELVLDLELESESLWPPYPGKIDEMHSWLDRARGLIGRRARYIDALGSIETQLELIEATTQTEGHFNGVDLRQRAEVEDLQSRRGRLLELVGGIDRTVAIRDDSHGNIEGRLRFAESLQEDWVTSHQKLWNEVIASIADPELCPKYGGLTIRPQMGLVPIGLNPNTGLWEFLVYGTGDAPLPYTLRKRPIVNDPTGIVLVLLPGGSFDMGIQKDNPNGVNYDRHADSQDGPPRKVTLSPFFISKFEVTQAQWQRLMGINPSQYNSDIDLKNRFRPFSHPVEGIGRDECIRALRRRALVLPTEAQWEYAARAGTSSIWWTGNDPVVLQKAANLADHQFKQADRVRHTENWDDGYPAHSPVGWFRANPFGLHDVIGNVNEWCLDFFDLNAYSIYTPRAGDGLRDVPRSTKGVVRGGSFGNLAAAARSGYRMSAGVSSENASCGVRPARPLQQP